MSKTPGKYQAGAITVLKGLEAVRKRPGMYIGSTGINGLHHLIWEVVDNSVDEAMAGFAGNIDVILHKDGSCSVQDDGRGIPTDLHPIEKVSGVEVALTMLHSGGKFEGEAYAKSGGLHGVGVSVVNALSEKLEVSVDQRGKRHHMSFSKGKKTSKLEVTGKTKRSGTLVRFWPDTKIFETTEWDTGTVATRMRQTAALNPGLKLRLSDERKAPEFKEEYLYEKGIAEMVGWMTEGHKALHPAIHARGEADGVDVDVAFQYTEGEGTRMLSFANTVNTPDGGTHEMGFKAALGNVMRQMLEEYGNREQKKIGFQASDLDEGLVAVVAVRVMDPQFEGQTKGRLNNTSVKPAVQGFLGDHLKTFFAKHPRHAKAILERAHLSARARTAAKKAREYVRSQKSLLETGVLPGKLSDCSSNDPSVSELFLVEGDSAAGSAKQGRNRAFQAILPLKGKILNVEKAGTDKIMANDEIRAIVTALGAGFGQGAEGMIEKVRYHKIIAMADGDVDGAHIRTLLLTLLFRHFPKLIEEGFVYMAQAPLYRLAKGKDKRYAYSEAEKDKIDKQMGGNASLQRYKGLGEMNPDELWSTTMDPATRVLLKVTIEDAVSADKTFSMLMGDDVGPRRDWITSNAQYVRNLDV